MKKIGILVLAVLLLSLALMGCQKKEAPAAAAAADPNAPVKLLVWCWDPNFNVYAMLEAEKIYRRTKPNVSLDVQDITNIEEKVITALSANDMSAMPDIILQQDNSIQKFVTNFPKAYLPLNGKVDLSKFAQYKLNVGYVNGQNYGVPFDNGAAAFFVRTDMLAQAGLTVADFTDITWDRFIELGVQLKQKTGKSLISFTPGGGDLVPMILMSTGTWSFDSSGKPYIQNNPVVRAIVTIYSQLVKTGVLLEVPDWNAYIASLNTDQVAGTLQGCWIIGSIVPAADQAGKWAMTNFPKVANIPTATNYTSNGGSGWMVMAHTKYADVCYDFLDKTWAGSTEFYDTILPSSGAISTWLPAASSSVYSQPQAFFGGQKVFEDLMSYASKIPQISFGVYNYEARDAIQRAQVNILNGGNIDSELAAAQRDVEFIMNQ